MAVVTSMVALRLGQEQLKAKSGAGERLGGQAVEPLRHAMQQKKGVLRGAC